MHNYVENGTLTLMQEGRIDSTNAAEFEKEIAEALGTNPGAALAVDAEKLEYISSATFRIGTPSCTGTSMPRTSWRATASFS